MFFSHMSSLKKCLFSSLAHFMIEFFTFLVLSCMCYLYILESNYLSVVSFAIIFSHSEGCLFTLLIISFIVQNILSLSLHLLIYLFLFPLLWDVGHRGPAVFDVRECSACFSLRVLCFWSYI